MQRPVNCTNMALVSGQICICTNIAMPSASARGRSWSDMRGRAGSAGRSALKMRCQQLRLLHFMCVAKKICLH